VSKSSVIVIGSSNTDMVVKTNHLPRPGETILGGSFFMNAGGKGANQAVAAARLGGDVTFFARVGKDIFGEQALTLFKKEGIDTSYIVNDNDLPSGVALITVDDKGENCIAVAPGANDALSADDLRKHEAVLKKSGLILIQLEIPLSTVEYAASIAADAGIPIILNPAPARLLPDELLQKITIITPNEKEAEMLTGIPVIDRPSAEKSALFLSEKGIKTIIITMGSQGALVLHEEKFTMIPAPKVNAVDSTAAGDVFNGALAVALLENMNLEDAVQFANKSAAISVTRLGAQASAPYRKELKD
jgi:ribokinase